MSTFTARAGVATCDRCGTVTADSWRAKAGHLCPRNVPAPTVKVRVCELCDTPLTRRPLEGSTDYHARRFCNRSCAANRRTA